MPSAKPRYQSIYVPISDAELQFVTSTGPGIIKVSEKATRKRHLTKQDRKGLPWYRCLAYVGKVERGDEVLFGMVVATAVVGGIFGAGHTLRDAHALIHSISEAPVKRVR